MSDAPSERLGVGGTIVTAAVALVIGALVGVMGTVAHRQWRLLLDAKSGEVAPFGLILALLLVLAAVTGLRLVFDSRIIAFAAVVGALAATTVFAQPSSGGSLLVRGDWLGYSWLIGQIVLGLLPVAWPDRWSNRWPNRRRNRRGRESASGPSDAPVEPR